MFDVVGHKNDFDPSIVMVGFGKINGPIQYRIVVREPLIDHRVQVRFEV